MDRNALETYGHAAARWAFARGRDVTTAYTVRRPYRLWRSFALLATLATAAASAYLCFLLSPGGLSTDAAGLPDCACLSDGGCQGSWGARLFCRQRLAGKRERFGHLGHEDEDCRGAEPPAPQQEARLEFGAAGSAYGLTNPESLPALRQATARITSGRGWPAPGEVTTSVVVTTLCFVFLPQALVLLSTQHGRKNAYVVVETVLASVLVVLLLAIVLGLPLGAPLLLSRLASPGLSNELASLCRAHSMQTPVVRKQQSCVYCPRRSGVPVLEGCELFCGLLSELAASLRAACRAAKDSRTVMLVCLDLQSFT